MNDVVVIDPSDSSPVGFNPLSFSHTQVHSLLRMRILAVFKISSLTHGNPHAGHSNKRTAQPIPK
jgi:hypothetical protein